MTVPAQNSQVQVHNTQSQDAKPSDKELNFRRQEAMYQKMLAEKDARISEIERQNQARQMPPEDEDDDEPYVNKKSLNKQLNKFGQQAKQETQSEIQRAVQTALSEERKQNWLKNNADFYDVLQHAETFAQHDPELAETILEMPEGFERQKLVYKNIKALGLHKPKVQETTIQQKVDANRRSPYYQPSGVSNAPYSTVSDYSPSGQKNAYEQMQKLKSQLRI